MTRFRLAFAACGTAALIVGSTGSSHASGAHAGSTYVTFSGRVALPGVELAAGTYIFERAEPMGDSSIVRVLTRDRRKNLLLAMTLPVDRPASLRAGAAMASLGEGGRGIAPPVKAWFPADESIGHAFIYAR